MEWQDLMADAYGRMPELMERILNGLQQADMDWRPSEDTNSIGWLLWHATRGLDAQIAALAGDEQLYIKDGWHAKFNREADPKDVGFGHTTEQVAAFRSPAPEVFVDYNKAVVARTVAYLKTLTGKDLDRELNEPWFQPLPTLGVRLVSIMEDGMLHAGQAAYLRGLRQGKGWQKF